jgi:hypothetical protein
LKYLDRRSLFPLYVILNALSFLSRLSSIKLQFFKTVIGSCPFLTSGKGKVKCSRKTIIVIAANVMGVYDVLKIKPSGHELSLGTLLRDQRIY